MVSKLKLQELAALAVATKDFRPLAEAYNENALELVADVLAKHTATMLEALHSLASPIAGAVVPDGCALVRTALTLPIANALGYDAKFNTWEEMQEVWSNALLAAAPEVPK